MRVSHMTDIGPALAADATAPRTAEPGIAVIVLNWNGVRDTLDCLASLRSLDYGNFGVIVVDNGSTDGSAGTLRAAHPWVEVVETGANLGFSGGNNVGIVHALARGADYLLLLNNDTVVDPGVLRALVAAAALHPAAAAFSPKIYFHGDPRRIWYAGTRWDPETAMFRHVGRGQVDGGAFAKMGPTAYASGCALFAPASSFREIGLLDERFFLMYEETDWCYRAHKAGRPSIFVPGALVWHKVSASVGGYDSPLARYFLSRNGLLWARRHLSRRDYRRFRARRLYELGQRLFPASRGRGPAGSLRILAGSATDPGRWAHALGILDHLLGRYGNCPAIVRRLGKGRP
jgi:GT2 family glycosyltransferase